MVAALDRSNAFELLLGGVGGGGIAQAFRRMEIAEQEIEEAKRRWPRRKRAIHAAFGVLCAPRLASYSDAVYRAHAREIIGRVMRGEDVRPGTDAEVLATLSEASLRAPLASDHAHAMSRVFARVFPDADMGRFAAGNEAWAGRTNEIIKEARRKLATDRSVR